MEYLENAKAMEKKTLFCHEYGVQNKGKVTFQPRMSYPSETYW